MPAATLDHANEYGEEVSWPSSVAPLKNSTLLIVAPVAGVAVALMVMLAGAANVALFAGAVMLTVGGVGVTVTDIAVEVAATLRLSVAFAVSEYVPAATPVHVNVSGAVVFVPRSVAPLKKSTLLMVAPVSAVALAVIDIDAGATKVALFAGDVMLTTGGGVVTVTATAVDVLVPPELSVALAVSE